MKVRKISSDNKELNNLKKLYLEAFPKEERLDFKFLTEKQNEGKGNFLGFYDDEGLVGMMYYAEYKGIVYIFYFAVDPKYRSKGYGKIMLNYMCEKFNEHKIILLVEELDENAENNDQRIRRKNFYLRNAFTGNEQFLVALGINFELLHWQGHTAFVSDYKKIQQHYYCGLEGKEKILKTSCS